MTHRKWILILVAALLTAPAAPVAGQTRGVDLQRALDRSVNLQIDDATIVEVFAGLQKKAGVKFILDEETLACLPYGAQTRLAVKLSGVTLRKALTPLLNPQALRWEIDGDLIRIRPTGGLRRMCRRATFEELKLLGKIYSEKLQPAAEGGAVIDQLRRVTGQKDLRVFFRVKGADEEAAFKRGQRALPGTGSGWLYRICQGQNWAWYLWGDHIVIIGRADQTGRQLRKQVTLEYRNSALVNVLLDLARKARVRLTIAPGVMGFLPRETRESFNLRMADASIAEALEVISGATGLQFVRTPEGAIRVEASETLKNDAEAIAERGRTRSRFFVRMTLPGPHGTQIEVFMRPEELPDDILEQIEKAKEKFIAELRGEVTD